MIAAEMAGIRIFATGGIGACIAVAKIPWIFRQT